MMNEMNWEVKYFSDYPSENGLQHIFWAVGIPKDETFNFNYRKIISMHQASGCLIDHNARISDIEIPGSLKISCDQEIWFLNNII